MSDLKKDILDTPELTKGANVPKPAPVPVPEPEPEIQPVVRGQQPSATDTLATPGSTRESTSVSANASDKLDNITVAELEKIKPVSSPGNIDNKAMNAKVPDTTPPPPSPPTGSTPPSPTKGGEPDADATGGKKEMFMVALARFLMFFGIVCFILLYPIFFFMISDVYNMRKRQKREQKLIENGTKVLIGESLLYNVLKYANINAGNNDAEPFHIYMPLIITKVMFNMVGIYITIIIYLIAFQLYFALDGKEMGNFKNDYLIKGIAVALFAAIAMLIFVKYIYVKIFQNGILEDIRKKYNALIALDNKIYNNMTTNNAFYNYLTAGNIKAIEKEIVSMPENEIVKQIVTLNIYEYYKGIVPGFDSSEIKTIFFTYDGVIRRSVNPSLYLRVDCAHHIKNIFHVLDIEFPPDLKVKLESQISSTMANLNQSIAKVKLESQPIIGQVYNYMKLQATYMLFVSIIGLFVVSKTFSLDEYLLAIMDKIKTVFSWMIEKITALIKKITGSK